MHQCDVIRRVKAKHFYNTIFPVDRELRRHENDERDRAGVARQIIQYHPLGENSQRLIALEP